MTGVWAPPENEGADQDDAMGEADAWAGGDTCWHADHYSPLDDAHAEDDEWWHDEELDEEPQKYDGEWDEDDSWWAESAADAADTGDALTKYTPDSSTPVPSNIADIMKTSIESGSSVTYTQQPDGVVTLVVKPHVSHVPTVNSNRWARRKAHREAQQSGCISKASRITSVTMCAHCDMRQPATRCPQVMCTQCCLEMMKGACDFAGHKFN